jgi:hypothetical protein
VGKRKNRISGQFTARLVEMQESPAFRVLSLSALRALSRIEIELAHHGGADNGKLPVTFDDFERYGIHRHSIGPALDELEALGFIKITERGTKAIRAEYRRSNKFRLTYRHADGFPGDGTHDWRRFKTIEEAEAALDAVRQQREKSKVSQSKNLKAASAKNALKAVRKTHCKNKNASAETALLYAAKNALLSISRDLSSFRSSAAAPTVAGDGLSIAPDAGVAN